MIFWLMVIGIAVFVGLSVWLFHVAEDNYNDGLLVLAVISAVLALALLILVGVFGAKAVISSIGLDGEIAKMQCRYDALIYKAENGDVRDEFGFLNKSYIDEIQEWNTDLAYNKTNQRDFWIGIFIPDIYDQFEYIDLNKIAMRDAQTEIEP